MSPWIVITKFGWKFKKMLKKPLILVPIIFHYFIFRKWNKEPENVCLKIYAARFIIFSRHLFNTQNSTKSHPNNPFYFLLHNKPHTIPLQFSLSCHPWYKQLKKQHGVVVFTVAGNRHKKNLAKQTTNKATATRVVWIWISEFHSIVQNTLRIVNCGFQSFLPHMRPKSNMMINCLHWGQHL